MFMRMSMSDLEDTIHIRCNITSSTEWYSWLSKFEDMSAQKFVVKRTYQLSLDVIIEQSKCTWCLAA